ncbi:MAG: hypothetical protein KDI48_09740 [Xanthomonadales bacterium]|nr:hypothetical protein [Xanthomonadales bacterium]
MSTMEQVQRRAVGVAVDQQFGRGIVDTLLQLVRDRFNVADLPAAWLHWPITAGGLGLHQPRLETLGLELAYKRAKDGPNPADFSEDADDIPF